MVTTDRGVCVLCQDVRLLQADGQPEVHAGMREAVHQRLQFQLVQLPRQHVSDEVFTYFCFGSEAGEVDRLPSDLVRR